MKKAQWIISEAGIQSLHLAGISTGWLKAWILSAGADKVSLHLLEPGDWQQHESQWRIFFASEQELLQLSELLALKQGKTQQLLLVNPDRVCWFHHSGQNRILLLPVGDIAYQRQLYLKLFGSSKPLLPLHILSDEKGSIMLEPGLTASLAVEAGGDENLLNNEGLLPEEQVITALRHSGVSMRTVESCTAGAIAARLCRMPGSSDVIDRSWVTYSNESKQQEVSVPAVLIERFGAVSQQVVEAMALGGVDQSHVCISVSGIAGPGGGTEEKPVGTVWIAAALPGKEVVSRCLQLSGARHEIQAKTVVAALSLFLELV